MTHGLAFVQPDARVVASFASFVRVGEAVTVDLAGRLYHATVLSIHAITVSRTLSIGRTVADAEVCVGERLTDAEADPLAAEQVLRAAAVRLALHRELRDVDTRPQPEQPRQIKGTWPDGESWTATQYSHANNFSEWIDDRFGQVFDIDPAVIGPDVDSSKVLAETERDTAERLASGRAPKPPPCYKVHQ